MIIPIEQNNIPYQTDPKYREYSSREWYPEIVH